MDPTRRSYRLLEEHEIRQIHQAALRILSETGLLIEDAQTRSELLRAGCRTGEAGTLRFPAQMVARALVSVPPRLRLYDRDGRAAVDTNDPTPRFCPGVNCVDFLDVDTGTHRPCTLADIGDAARLCERLPHLDMAGSLGNPSDVEPRRQALETVRTLTAHSRKPFPFLAHDEAEAEGIWDYLAELAGGENALRDKPFAMDLTGPTSPLRIGAEACRRLRLAARRGVPVVCYPALMPGVNGPVTLAGALAQSTAEILAGIAIHQTACPGAPVISGSAVVPFDMHTVRLAYGAPEYILACLAAAEILRYLGIPSWVGAGCTDAHVVDAQAGAEAGANMLAAALSGTSLVHNLGYLSSGKTGSLEMLMLCDELAGLVRRVATAIQVTEETLAVGLVHRAARTGRFLTELRHTATHLKRESWRPGLFQRLALDRWQQEGAPSVESRIRARVRDLLAS